MLCVSFDIYPFSFHDTKIMWVPAYLEWYDERRLLVQFSDPFDGFGCWISALNNLNAALEWQPYLNMVSKKQ